MAKLNMPQKGNPYSLSVNQHIFPKKSISRFCGASNGVDTVLFQQHKRVTLKPTNKLFTYTRRWDQKAELHLKEIEDSFQEVAEKIRVRNSTNLKPKETEIITEFFLSWWARSQLTQIEDQLLKGVIGPSHSLSVDEHEALEAAGIMTIKENCTIPGNRLAWPLLRRRMDREYRTKSYKRWGLLTTKQCEFCCPDYPALPAIPLTPKQLLYLNVTDQEIGADIVRDYNRQSSTESKAYVFGRNLNHCIGVNIPSALY